MHRDCQDCGNTYYAGDYNGGTIVEGCPKCGSYRTQPNPIHSEMEVRDMPGPAASGLEDQGGNPLKEGILADGGWNNRMKRDESFASVKKTAAEFPASTSEMGLHNDPRGGLSRLSFKTRKMGPLMLQGTVTPREGEPFEVAGPYHDHANGCTTTADPAGLHSGECIDSCLHQQIPTYSHFQGAVSHPSDKFGNVAAQIISEESMNPLRRFEAERQAEKAAQQGLQPQAHIASDDGWDDDEDENPYVPESHDISDRFIVTPEGKVLRGGEGAYQNGVPTHESIAVENGMRNGEFAQGHSLGVVHPNRSISFVQHQTPFSQEQLQQMIEPHYPGHSVNPVEQVSNEERWGIGQGKTPDELYLPGHGGPEGREQATQEAEAQRGGKPFGHYDNPYFNRGGSARERVYVPLFHDSASIDSDFDVEQIIPPGHHTVEVSVDGEKNPVILQHDNSDALDAAKTKLEARSAGIIGSLLGGGIGGAIGTALAPETGGLSLALPLVGRMVGNAVGRGVSGGGGDQQQAPRDYSQPLDALSSFHESLTTDLSNPGFEDTDDPEDVDQKEKNDGDNKDWQKDPNDIGGSDHGPDIPLDSDVGKAFQEALPALIKYYDSDESGADDPAIAHLVQLVEAEHPGLIDPNHKIDDGDLADIHAAKGTHVAAAPVVPGIGQAPGATPMGTPPTNPMANSIPCPACGALGAGAGNCTQCGMPLQQAPNVQHPIGQTPMGPAQTGPPQAQHVMAANQGPHNPEQFKAVADYLQQTSPPDQITGILQDLINNPQNYGDVLAQIQNKGTTPQPDPDPGAPPPQPPMQDPNAQAPPGMMPPPQAKVAAPHDDHGHGNTIGIPAADQQGQRDVSHEEDSSGYWKTSDGAPLQVGAEYEMYSNQYDIPDIIQVTAVKPESIEYILTGEYGLEHRTELTRTEAEMDGTTFQPAQDGEGPSDDETQGDQPHQAPHAFAKVKEAADSIAPKCPECGSHTTETMNSDVHPGNFSCHNCGHVWEIKGVVPTKSGAAHPSVVPGPLYPEEERLQSYNYPNDGEIMECPHCGTPTQASLGGCPHCLRTWPNRTAGAKFTPMEQREFIDEPGEARNMDKLDLSHTHYESANLTSDDFLFGL